MVSNFGDTWVLVVLKKFFLWFCSGKNNIIPKNEKKIESVSIQKFLTDSRLQIKAP